MIINLVTLVLFGFVLHEFRTISERLDDGIQNIADHAVGGLGILLAWPVVGWRMGFAWKDIERVELALVIILFGLGVGVCSGWLRDTIREIIRKMKLAE